MSAKEYTSYQHGIIKRYYENADALTLQRLQELVTELYLAQNTPREDRLWDQVQKALVRLKVKPALQAHIMQKRQVVVLAANLQDWLKPAGKK